MYKLQFSSVAQSRPTLGNPISARQASLSITISQSSLKLTYIKLVMPSSHLILCQPLFLLPPIPPSIRVFSIESTICMRWPKYWSFSCISFCHYKQYGMNEEITRKMKVLEMKTTKHI